MLVWFTCFIFTPALYSFCLYTYRENAKSGTHRQKEKEGCFTFFFIYTFWVLSDLYASDYSSQLSQSNQGIFFLIII